MGTATNAKITYESEQTLVDFVAATTTDGLVFKTAGAIWSARELYKPVIIPNGIVTGRNLITPHADNNKISFAAFTAYSMGVLKTVAAADITVVRGATADIAKINSIVMNSAGTVSNLAGADSTDTTVNEVRGAAGGPPFIPADSVETGQIRFSGTGAGTAAPVTSAQIFQVVGTHTERSDYPVVAKTAYLGDGILAKTPAKTTAYIEYASAVPAIHTGTTHRQVWIKYYNPVFSPIQYGFDFVPVLNSASVESTQVYGRISLNTVSTSIGQGSFETVLQDGVTDGLVQLNGEILTFKFYPDQNKTAYILSQGMLTMDQSFPVSGSITAKCTIAAEQASVNFAG